MRLDNLRLLADDVPACHKFLVDQLGWKPRFDAPDAVYQEYDVPDGKMIALFDRGLMQFAVEGEKKAPPEPSDSVAVVLMVDDVDASYEQLRAKGVAFVKGPTDQKAWMLRVAHFRTPAGHLFEICQPLPQ